MAAAHREAGVLTLALLARRNLRKRAKAFGNVAPMTRVRGGGGEGVDVEVVVVKGWMWRWWW